MMEGKIWKEGFCSRHGAKGETADIRERRLHFPDAGVFVVIPTRKI